MRRGKGEVANSPRGEVVPTSPAGQRGLVLVDKRVEADIARTYVCTYVRIGILRCC